MTDAAVYPSLDNPGAGGNEKIGESQAYVPDRFTSSFFSSISRIS